MANKENVGFERQDEKELSPVDDLMGLVDTIKKKYIAKGTIGKKRFGLTAELREYQTDMASVLSALGGALAVLETEGEERKTVLRNLGETYQALLGVLPPGTTSSKDPETILRILDKYLEGQDPGE